MISTFKLLTTFLYKIIRSVSKQDTTNDRNDDEQALIELADEFLGIERKQLGRYKWVSLNESLLTALDRWRQRPYFCPYRPYHGKWIMTCKSDVQNVSFNTNNAMVKFKRFCLVITLSL